MKTLVLLIASLLIAVTTFAQSGPELVFENPVLVSGTANKQGAVYRFSNVTTGVDAEIKLKKFSRNDIVMSNIDNPSLGWPKAFQPEFGIPGLVLPFQNWYIDFEMSFYKAGTNNHRKMDTVDLTALDVDGDNNSISEYVTYDKPSSIVYSSVSFLTSILSGTLGQSFECGEDGISSILLPCIFCGGDGTTNSGSGNNNECEHCDGSGKVHSLCGHAYEGGTGSTVNGPINNFLNIDTAATQVMATYQFLKKDKIKFRYGAKSSLAASNGSGVRLNSTWFRKFSMEPVSTLPVRMESFNAVLTSNNKVELKWITSSEINASHFVVEKSKDGKNFTEAGLVFAYGNTSDRITYTFTDATNTATDKVVYYRLRSVDLDTKSEYSTTRVIRMGGTKESTLAILTYPNPATSELRITIPSTWQGKKVSYEIFNSTGTALQKQIVSSSSQTESMNVKSLAPGFYIVKASCGEQVAQQKIIKQ